MFVWENRINSTLSMSSLRHRQGLLRKKWIASNWKWERTVGILCSKGMVKTKEPKSCPMSLSAGLFKLCSTVCQHPVKGHCRPPGLRPCFKQHRTTFVWLILNFGIRVCLIKNCSYKKSLKYWLSRYSFSLFYYQCLLQHLCPYTDRWIDCRETSLIWV